MSVSFAVVLLVGVFLAWGGDEDDPAPAELPTVFEVLNADPEATSALAGEAAATPARLEAVGTVEELEAGDFDYVVVGTEAPPELVAAARRGVQVGSGPDDLVVYSLQARASTDPDDSPDLASSSSTTTTAAPTSTSTSTSTSTTSTTEPSAPPTPAAPPPAEDQPELNKGSTHEVVSGESFWTIAEDQVAASLGRAGTTAEVTEYWAGLVDTNLDRLVEAGNPDLLLPGQVVDLPPP